MTLRPLHDLCNASSKSKLLILILSPRRLMQSQIACSYRVYSGSSSLAELLLWWTWQVQTCHKSKYHQSSRSLTSSPWLHLSLKLIHPSHQPNLSWDRLADVGGVQMDLERVLDRQVDLSVCPPDEFVEKIKKYWMPISLLRDEPESDSSLLTETDADQDGERSGNRGGWWWDTEDKKDLIEYDILMRSPNLTWHAFYICLSMEVSNNMPYDDLRNCLYRIHFFKACTIKACCYNNTFRLWRLKFIALPLLLGYSLLRRSVILTVTSKPRG